MKDSYILLIACKWVFWTGGGDNWHEKDVLGNHKSVLYVVYVFFLFASYAGITVLEFLAPKVETLSQEDKFNAISHGVIHCFFMFKLAAVAYKRQSIKNLIYNLISTCDSIDDVEVSKVKYKEIKFVCGTYFSCIYGASLMYFLYGILNTIGGQHFYLLITYYGEPLDDSKLATCFRFATAFVVMFVLASVTMVDILVIKCMVVYKYKFVLLKKYFEELYEEYKGNMSRPGRDINAVSDEMYGKLKEGFILHIEVVRLSGELDDSLGALTAAQLFCTSFPAVFQMLQLALSDNMTLVDSFKIVSFILTVFLLLGIYLCTIGNITEEAATLKDSVFYCGWHLCPPSAPAYRKIKSVMLIECALSQQPISMKAFKMLELTHATYIRAIKSTYSIYALLRAQNQ